MVIIVALSLLLSFASIKAHPAHHEVKARSLFQSFGVGDWAQPADHPVVRLFKRNDDAADDTNGDAPLVGSDAWYSQYPSGTPDPADMPQSWKDALNAALQQNLIPDIVLSNVNGTYPKGTNAGGEDICNAAAGCRADDDIWDAPEGMLGVSFDDGPTTNSPVLYDFLQSQGQKATHFFIGENILAYPKIFLQAFGNGDDIAVHTWTHPFMTSRTNEEIMTEFGWTMQIISDLTGGRVPRYWRPPNGDSDNRVRAIARHIFGLTQVDWNRDTNDWQLPDHTVTPDEIAANLSKWITGPKSPGLIILEHELYAGTVQAFIDAYPSMKENGWDTRSIPDLFGSTPYLNAVDNNSTVVPMSFINPGSSVALQPSSSTAPPSAGSTTSSTASFSAAATTPSAVTNKSKTSDGGSRNLARVGSWSPSAVLLLLTSGLLLEY